MHLTPDSIACCSTSPLNEREGDTWLADWRETEVKAASGTLTLPQSAARSSTPVRAARRQCRYREMSGR
jgi:hypothetical protein